MATNKAKRSIHLAQPERPRTHHKPAELMPVKAHVYRSIAELNGGFEKVIQDLQTLQRISFFRSGALDGMHHLIATLRAQANHQLMTVLTQREMSNAGYFGRVEREPDSGAAVK
jgi:hypothetical protein